MFLAGVCFFVFSMTAIASRVYFAYEATFASAIYGLFGLSWPLLKSGFFWQPVTYMFLHQGWLHLLFNMMVILFFGSGVEVEVGGRRFATIFFLGGILGGMGWLAMLALQPWLPPLPDWSGWVPEWVRTWMPKLTGKETLATGLCIGASGGVFSLIGAYAAMFPSREVVWFVPFPLRLSARRLAVALGVLSLLEILFVQAQVAYAAHIIGGLAGYAYGLWLNKRGYYGD